jgi:probable rRNA maturation factor
MYDGTMSDDPSSRQPGPGRPPFEVAVPHQAGDWPDILPEAPGLVERAALAALMAAEAPRPASLAVALSDDAQVRRLNAEYRGRDKPTNVLSFPDGDTDPEGTTALGDVVLALETLQREAAEQGKPLADHLAHLTVHGVLHLLGWDHETDPEAEAMEEMERRVLAGLAVPDPYAAPDAPVPGASPRGSAS